MISERHHFLISKKNIRGNRFELNGSEGFHLSRVARLKVGDEIFLLDLHGNAHRGTIETIHTGVVSGTILDKTEQYRGHRGAGDLR